MTSALIARREAQIHGYLKTMSERAKTAGTCFIVFGERPPEEVRRRSASTRLEPTSRSRRRPSANWCDQRQSGNDLFQYFTQFGFDDDRLRIDLPNTTLHLNDAERLLLEREGFFWLRDVQSESHPNTREFNPLQKVYSYGQERLAAADMLYLLLNVWNIPPDFRWYVKAAPFEGDGRWEWGEMLA